MTAKKPAKKNPEKATRPKTSEEEPFSAESDAPPLEKGETALPVKAEDGIPDSVPIYVCTPNRALFWPLPGTPPRGGPGTVVRGDDPFVNVRGYPNQFYKLKKVTEEQRESGSLELLIGRGTDGEKEYLRVDVSRITPCASRRMHKEYESRGITWMPLEIHNIEEVSTIQPREAKAARFSDFQSGDEGFEAPDLTD